MNHSIYIDVKEVDYLFINLSKIHIFFYGTSRYKSVQKHGTKAPLYPAIPGPRGPWLQMTASLH